MNISVCCPSYKRPRVKTLDYLPFCKVYVDHKEYEEYVSNNKEGANIISCPEGIQGNVARIRNYILDTEFTNGADAVVLLDDDLSGVFKFTVASNNFGYVQEIITAEQFMPWVEKYTRLCSEFGYKLWGVNCNFDKLSYKHYSPFSTLSVVLGPFCCHLKNDIRYDEALPLKEDYDMAIQHLNKYRGILRLNGFHYVCAQSTNKGGCAVMRNQRREKEQFELLQKKWGSQIVREDRSNKGKTKKQKRFDYNPIIKVPIKGI